MCDLEHFMDWPHVQMDEFSLPFSGWTLLLAYLPCCLGQQHFTACLNKALFFDEGLPFLVWRLFCTTWCIIVLDHSGSHFDPQVASGNVWRAFLVFTTGDGATSMWWIETRKAAKRTTQYRTGWLPTAKSCPAQNVSQARVKNPGPNRKLPEGNGHCDLLSWVLTQEQVPTGPLVDPSWIKKSSDVPRRLVGMSADWPMASKCSDSIFGWSLPFWFYCIKIFSCAVFQT